MILFRPSRLWYALRFLAGGVLLAFSCLGAPATAATPFDVGVAASTRSGSERVVALAGGKGIALAIAGRRTEGEPTARGSVSVSRGPFLAVVGAVRLRSLAGWSSGQLSSSGERASWRHGDGLALSTSATAPVGVGLGGRFSRLWLTLAALRASDDRAAGGAGAPASAAGTPGDAGVAWYGSAGAHVGGVSAEVAAGWGNSSDLRVDATIGIVRGLTGIVAGTAISGQQRAERLVVARRLGPCRVRAGWERANGAFEGPHPAFGRPITAWTAVGGGPGWEVALSAREQPDALRTRSGLGLWGRMRGIGWRGDLTRLAGDQDPSVAVGWRLDGPALDRGRWTARTRVGVGRDGEISWLFAGRLGGGLGGGMTWEVSAAATHAGPFWSAVTLGLGGLQPVYLASGERMWSVRISGRWWEIFYYEHGAGDRHRLGAACALRWRARG